MRHSLLLNEYDSTDFQLDFYLKTNFLLHVLLFREFGLGLVSSLHMNFHMKWLDDSSRIQVSCSRWRIRERTGSLGGPEVLILHTFIYSAEGTLLH